MTQLTTIEVLRPFYLAGCAHAVGTVVEVPSALALELINLGKAARVLAPSQDAAPAKRSRKPKGEAA